MKKMYNQPATEVVAFQTEQLLQGITLSPGSGTGPGKTEAPARKGTLIPD